LWTICTLTLNLYTKLLSGVLAYFTGEEQIEGFLIHVAVFIERVVHPSGENLFISRSISIDSQPLDGISDLRIIEREKIEFLRGYNLFYA